MKIKSTLADPKIIDYVSKMSLRETPAQQALREETGKHQQFRMMSQHDEMQFLALLLKLMNAKKVIEVGVFTGYGTLTMAQALPDDGKVYALDVSEEYTSVGMKYWKEGKQDDKIELILQPAVKSLDELLKDEKNIGTFDMMYIDADKSNYDLYYERGLKLLRKGGVIAIDNTLWDGKVLDPEVNDDDTKALKNLNEKLKNDKRIDISMLAIADGLTLCMKQ